MASAYSNEGCTTTFKKKGVCNCKQSAFSDLSFPAGSEAAHSLLTEASSAISHFHSVSHMASLKKAALHHALKKTRFNPKIPRGTGQAFTSPEPEGSMVRILLLSPGCQMLWGLLRANPSSSNQTPLTPSPKARTSMLGLPLEGNTRGLISRFSCFGSIWRHTDSTSIWFCQYFVAGHSHSQERTL